MLPHSKDGIRKLGTEVPGYFLPSPPGTRLMPLSARCVCVLLLRLRLLYVVLCEDSRLICIVLGIYYKQVFSEVFLCVGA